jgi:hypothetical protein
MNLSNNPIDRLKEVNDNFESYCKAMKPKFTFAKADSDNIPSNIDQSTFNNERDDDTPIRPDDSEDEPDGDVDFISNEDL